MKLSRSPSGPSKRFKTFQEPSSRIQRRLATVFLDLDFDRALLLDYGLQLEDAHKRC